MAIESDRITYFQSISDQLTATKNRVRNLIGGSHWPSDGAHKEIALRNILRKRLPRTYDVFEGFVIYETPYTLRRNPSLPNTRQNRFRQTPSSGQIDILITPTNQPIVQRDEDDDMVCVTADTVEVIVEVKTLLRRGFQEKGLARALSSLADKVEGIRNNAYRTDGKTCWAGLFVYEPHNIRQEDLLEALYIATNNDPSRAIDCVAIGPSLFAHFWSNAQTDVDGIVNGPAWHSYQLERLAPGYFISNIVAHVSPPMPDATANIWFPIPGGKETKRQYYIPLNENRVSSFDITNNSRPLLRQ